MSPRPECCHKYARLAKSPLEWRQQETFAFANTSEFRGENDPNVCCDLDYLSIYGFLTRLRNGLGTMVISNSNRYCRIVHCRAISHSGLSWFYRTISTGPKSSFIDGAVVMLWATGYRYQLWTRWNYTLAAAINDGFSFNLFIQQ